MADIGSFENKQNKLEKLWEQQEANEISINNLEKLEISFKSINFIKKISTINIPILSNNLQDNTIHTQIDNIFNISLKDFPDWLINHIKVFPVAEIIEPIDENRIFGTFLPGITSATPNYKVGDVSPSNTIKYWIASLGSNNHILKVYVDFGISKLTFVDNESFDVVNFASTAIPFRFNLSLKIINPRIYENSNEYKQ